ncbi:RNA polymerase sigma factor [Echinicola vietnamensis]|uniref:RNA polymerase sigma factor, sigma-70 family n=1 Tax=Echinicola vietnamensis (strain DSM 17526 / LMG 23754 / KMM 6221) TaxID=926556 RepID=L0FYA1_ECHVK|nr:RNA polymerase sigma factor [Echinicola vietnamensis]AGA77998.1 RNA polymerase sigma factor, sigma-70 family [Echinicola vietnamensis DSM 17526]
MKQNSEKDLITRCSKQDRKAQFELFERYKVALYSSVFRILNEEDLAHDALQEAFIEIFKGIKKFRGECTLGFWMKRIAIRKAIKLAKSRILFTPLDQVTALPDRTPLDGWIDGELLDVAIRELPTGCRSVFLLIEVEGYKHAECAALLSISENTSKSQLSYAKKLLRGKLNELIKA